MNAIPDLTKTLDDLASQLQTMADRAVHSGYRRSNRELTGGERLAIALMG